MSNRITPFLWFDGQAEEAATFYTSIFKNSRIVESVRYGEAGPGPTGTVMTVLKDRDPAKSQRVMTAVIQMIKIDLAQARRAYEQG